MGLLRHEASKLTAKRSGFGMLGWSNCAYATR